MNCSPLLEFSTIGTPNLERAPFFDKDTHAFARFLRANEWDDTEHEQWVGSYGLSRFIDKNGTVLAEVLYDNRACTNEIWARNPIQPHS